MRSVRGVIGVSLGVSLALCACNKDGMAGTDSDSGTTGAETETETETETDSDTEGALPVDVPARGGLTIERVEANQGIGVDIGLDGAGVGGGDRTAYLVQGRVTLIRAFWGDLPPGWKDREIEGRLTLHFPDGSTEVKTKTIMVDGPSFVGDLNRAFFWGLEVDRVFPLVKYSIELFEVEAGWEDIPEPEGAPPRAPHNGTAHIGIEDSYQRLKVVVVPFNYTSPNCTTDLSVISERAQTRMSDYIFMMNPVDTLEISFREALEFNGEIQSLGQINAILEDLRFEPGESPDNPEVYYYGVIDPCSGGVGGAGGLANGIPSSPAKGLAYQRVSSGILREIAASGESDDWLNINSDTFVHEVGHSQGRRHVRCSGGEAGIDPAYPVPGGDIGEWGWGVIDFHLKHETVYKDYMTYCNPAWVSTYGWNKVYPFIEELSSWDLEDAPPPGESLAARYGGEVLVGMIYPGGGADWYTVPGVVEGPASAVHRVELASDEGPSTTLEARASDLDDGTLRLVAPLPEGVSGLASVDALVWFDEVAGTSRAFTGEALAGPVTRYLNR